MRIEFWKMSGAGNDFVLLAGLPKGAGGHALARALCDRRAGVGADGLLVVTRRGGRLRLDYRNADGSAAFCGNGARCAALWAAARGWAKGREVALDTAGGPLLARATAPGRAEVSMPAPRRPRLGLRLKAAGRSWTAHFVEAGVPHAVVLVADVERVDVKRFGRALRSHRAFGRAGANVDFVEVRGDRLAVRTYERGVEDETFACGTGAVASAFVARELGRIGSPARVKARGGELSVSLGTRTLLEGPGRIVFHGEVEI